MSVHANGPRMTAGGYVTEGACPGKTRIPALLNYGVRVFRRYSEQASALPTMQSLSTSQARYVTDRCWAVLLRR